MYRFRSRAVAIVLGAVAGIVIGSVGFTPGTASASGSNCLNDASYACYARGTFNNDSQWGGGYVQVEVTGLSASSNAYLNEEMWTTTNGNSLSYWAEIGYSDNNPYCRGEFRWFYYYQNPNASNHACFGSTPSSGTWHQLEVQEDTSTSWYIYLDGNEISIDSGTSGWNYNDFTGLEYHDAGNTSMSGTAYFSYNEVRSTGCCTWYYWPSGGSEVNYPTVYNWTWTQDWIHGYDN